MPVPYGASLTSTQRLQLAKVSGTGQLWCFGAMKDRPRPEAIAAIHEESRDPAVLGIALGAALAAVELDGWVWNERLAELYRAAGADEQIAAVNLEWHRTQRRTLGRR
jgi:hypothetical protein